MLLYRSHGHYSFHGSEMWRPSLPRNLLKAPVSIRGPNEWSYTQSRGKSVGSGGIENAVCVGS